MFWEVGSEAVVLPYRTDQFEQIKITVVGIVEPIDPEEEYWMGFPSYFSPQEVGDVLLMPLYVPEPAFFDGLGSRYPTLVGDYGWYLYLDTDILNAGLVQPTRDAIDGLETDINKRVPRSLTLTRLENSRDTGLLATYQRSLIPGASAHLPVHIPGCSSNSLLPGAGYQPAGPHPRRRGRPAPEPGRRYAPGWRRCYPGAMP